MRDTALCREPLGIDDPRGGCAEPHGGFLLEDRLSKEKLAKKAHVANNSGNNEWYTPAKFINAARAVMGDIDCDPASSEVANRIVQAHTFYTIETDGLEQEWNGRVWMNPPYAQPVITHFCNTLVEKFEREEVHEACVLVNNATETTWFQKLLSAASAVCFPQSRIRFIDVEGKPAHSPLQGQAIVYFGNHRKEFASAFGFFGKVLYV